MQAKDKLNFFKASPPTHQPAIHLKMLINLKKEILDLG